MQISLTRPASATAAPTMTVPRSQAERLWLIGGGLAAFLLILIGFFFVISPQRSQTSDVDSQVRAATQQNGVLQQRIDALRSQNKNLSKYQDELAKAKLALPENSGVSDFLRTLQSLGSTTGTNVSSLTVGQPTDVSAALTAAPAGAHPTATTAPAAAAPAATGPKIYGLAITAQVSGAPTALSKFLQQLQEVQPRAVLITQITETDGGGQGTAAGAGGGPSLQLSMQAFVAPANP